MRKKAAIIPTMRVMAAELKGTDRGVCHDHNGLSTTGDIGLHLTAGIAAEKHHDT